MAGRRRETIMVELGGLKVTRRRACLLGVGVEVEREAVQ